jgi:very-short-patch-repair endonuclease
MFFNSHTKAPLVGVWGVGRIIKYRKIKCEQILQQKFTLLPASGINYRGLGGCQGVCYGKKPIYNTADSFVYKYIKDARNELVENSTQAETILWKQLKSCKTGYKIRRQHVIGKYVVDFVCLSHKLVIEIDGPIHLQQEEADTLRTYDLNDKGFRVIRFTNEEVYQNAVQVAQKIREVLDRIIGVDLPLTPSQGGESLCDRIKV